MVPPLFWGSWVLTDVFREVDEEVRREQLLKLWRRHSKHVIGAVVLVLAVVGAVLFWRQWQEQRRIDRANDYLAAASLPPAEAAEKYEALAGDDGYGVLARLREASLLAELGRRAEALAAFEAIAADSGVPQVYRDLAVVLHGQHALGQVDGAELVRRLEPLTAADNPWRFQAMELTALAELQSGNTARARSLFLTLADDAAAPAGLRGRAAEIAATLSAS